VSHIDWFLYKGMHEGLQKSTTAIACPWLPIIHTCEISSPKATILMLHNVYKRSVN